LITHAFVIADCFGMKNFPSVANVGNCVLIAYHLPFAQNARKILIISQEFAIAKMATTKTH
jgi:hypothetical protein